MNEDFADEKENVEPQVDIRKQPKDKPPDDSQKCIQYDTERSQRSPPVNTFEVPEVILEEDDRPIITTNGTCSLSPSPPMDVPPISSTTPTSQVSFLQHALAMGLQQPLHFLQNSMDQNGSQKPMSPTGLAQAKNILNFVDLLKAVGNNMPQGVMAPNMVMNSGNVTPNMQSPSLSNGSHPERNKLTCHICAQIMPSMHVLEEHVRIHEEEKPYKCDQCGQRYKYQSAFQRHQEQNHTAKLPGDKPYRCEVCGQCFKYHKSFTKHRANHDLLDNFLKTEPGEEGKGSTAMRALQESYLQRLLHPSFPIPEGGGPLVIKEETKEESEESSLKDAKSPCMVSSTSVPTILENGEIKEEDDIDIDEIVPDVPGDGEEDEDTGKFFYCTNCKLTFKDVKAFDGHCRLSPECSTETLKEVSVGGDISVTSIPSSESSPITSSPPPSSEGITLHSNSGSMVFSSPPGMLYTLVAGLPPNNTTSYPTTTAAPTILNLSKFVNIHHNGLPNILSGGPRSATDPLSSYNMGCTPIAPAGTTVGNLLSGLEDERPFKCPYCQKGFKGRENLKLHIRTHTGEKPYNCGVCGKAFGGRSDMNRHLRIHTGEKPYPCKVCGKKFARADYLSKHITTHLGIPFAKPVHSLQQSLQNLENMQNLQNLENIQNSVNQQSLFSALPSLQSLQMQQSVPSFHNLQSFPNLQSLQNLQTSVPNLQVIAPSPVTVHNSKEEIPNLSK